MRSSREEKSSSVTWSTPTLTYTTLPANSWSPSGTKVYPVDSSDEEGWTRTSEGTIVNYDLFQSIATNGSYAEKYNSEDREMERH